MSATITVSATDGSANALAYAIGARRRDSEERVAVAERRGAAAVVREYLRDTLAAITASMFITPKPRMGSPPGSHSAGNTQRMIAPTSSRMGT